MNEVITYQEVDKDHSQDQIEISFTIKENPQIKGMKKNLTTNITTLIIRKQITEDFIELIDFSAKNLEANTFYGQREPYTGEFTGNWRKTSIQDIKNLTDQVQIFPNDAYMRQYLPSIILKPYTKSVEEEKLNFEVLN